MSETWRAVPGFEGAYEVSDLGRVRSLDRYVACLGSRGTPVQKFARGVLLRPGLASNGYLTVSLCGDTRCIHELVLLAFVGPRPFAGAVCRHKDGDKTRSVLLNIEYGTQAENLEDMDRHGRRPRGTKYRSAKLTEATAREIRSLHYVVTQAELAEWYGVSPAAIQAVHDRRTWTHA